MRKNVNIKRYYVIILENIIIKEYYIDGIITSTNLVYYKEHYKEYTVTRGSDYRQGFGQLDLLITYGW
jgi:hypothetical protein